MLAVCGAEGIHYVAVSVGSELLCELLLAGLHCLLGLFVCRILLVDSDRLALLLRIVAEVLEHKHLARLEGSGCLGSVCTVRGELYRSTESGAYGVNYLAEAELRLYLALRLAHVAHHDEGTALLEYEFEGWESTLDAGVVGNLAVLKRNVEIYTHDCLFAGEIVSTDVSHSICFKI